MKSIGKLCYTFALIIAMSVSCTVNQTAIRQRNKNCSKLYINDITGEETCNPIDYPLNYSEKNH